LNRQDLVVGVYSFHDKSGVEIGSMPDWFQENYSKLYDVGPNGSDWFCVFSRV
jgi:hypothetical protein